MAEQTFRSPGFFENEIDLAAKDVAPQGVPAGIVGTAEKGPAFVPVTIGNFQDFIVRFGSLSPERFAPYAVREWLKNKTSLTFVRVLGAGSNKTVTDFEDTKNFGIVKNAGFVVPGVSNDDAVAGREGHDHCVQFISARHKLPNTDGGEMFGYPQFTDNLSFVEEVGDKVNLVRGVLMTTTGSRFELLPNSTVGSTAVGVIDCDAAGAHITNDDAFTILVPAAAGGDITGGAGVIRIDFHDTLQDAADDQINVHVQDAGAAATAAMVVKAINGVVDGSHIRYPEAGRGQAGVKGVTASVNASDTTLVDLTADGGLVVTTSPNTWGIASNEIVLTSVDGDTLILAALGTGRKMTGGGDGQYNFAASSKANWTTPTDFLNGASSVYKDKQTYFKLVLSTSADTTFANDEGHPGLKIFTASLEPTDSLYVGKILNTDPTKFYHERHLLYLDFAVESEVATVDTAVGSIALVSGSAESPDDISPKTYGGAAVAKFNELFGRFDTRYKTPKSPAIISQPFGGKEWDLFHFETISDGEWGNSKFKMSIANIKASTNPASPHGTFEVQLRGFDDTDRSTQILERYPECSLDPKSERYIARQIGDMKAYWNFDAINEEERRVIVKGKYPNRSHRIRVVMNEVVDRGLVPKNSLPFGFRGLEVLRTTDSLTDKIGAILTGSDGTVYGVEDGNEIRIDARILGAHTIHKGSIIPPLPMRFKVTQGAVENTGAGDGTSVLAANRYVGRPGTNERVDSRLYWGTKTTRLPITSSLPAGNASDAILNSNASSDPNPLITAYTKMHGIAKMGTIVTGSAADAFNSNKFTLARVALENSLSDSIADGVSNRIEKIVTGTAHTHMLQAAYMRSSRPDDNDYTVSDRFKAGRITMATLLNSSSIIFNRFAEFNKFTTLFYGGSDGTNILSRDAYYLTDRASSADPGGHAVSSNNDAYQGLSNLVGGTGNNNNVVSSYRTAVRIMTDPTTVSVNLLAIPGMRDSNIVDNALERVREYGFSMYVMDIKNYDQDTTRLFSDHKKKPDVRITAEQFDGLAIDNNYTATYFPDVFITDDVNIPKKPVRVPASIAAISALSYNDRVGFPWFAPAGFNRGSLTSVENVHTRLTSADRDELYDVRINPIAVFPSSKFVIFGQKTLQQAKSALDRVNVRRLMLEVKRRVSSTARKLLFEANDSQTRARFVGEVTPQLAIIQAQAGVERFSVICDTTNNSSTDEEENRMNGKIIIVPTLAVEFISMDFIVTSAGVSFE